jgi:hypothetical protein
VCFHSDWVSVCSTSHLGHHRPLYLTVLERIRLSLGREPGSGLGRLRPRSLMSNRQQPHFCACAFHKVLCMLTNWLYNNVGPTSLSVTTFPFWIGLGKGHHPILISVGAGCKHKLFRYLFHVDIAEKSDRIPIRDSLGGNRMSLQPDRYALRFRAPDANINAYHEQVHRSGRSLRKISQSVRPRQLSISQTLQFFANYSKLHRLHYFHWDQIPHLARPFARRTSS